ncbi:Lysophospholipase L1 [Lentzea xinjiangensis]|uniref:Lysophospholipase L1 n=1 Tax=Lentzea xinjiangensis TaxID=402600 RepID=A0A1H9P7R9_9PSEU|nr:SGNH/GDSL hydrolase family protein [Lentzea xinjiangensis]SER44286.1 Lysophospholipase L1 [Lentzea xinjiangensis]
MLVLLGDSTAVGIGDLVPGGWRGFGPILASAFEDNGYRNYAVSGARLADVRRAQLPRALRDRPSAAVVIAGVNDTLRSDFSVPRMHEDLDHICRELTAAGVSVVTVRFHDQGRVFKLPGRLRRVLKDRIDEYNRVIDVVVARHGVRCVDLHTLPGAYELRTWAVDRLHPSERGHRLLARAFAAELRAAGHAVGDVSLECSGGRELTVWHHMAWLLVKGVPWLWRRGADLLPLLWAGEAVDEVVGPVPGEVLPADTGRL